MNAPPRSRFPISRSKCEIRRRELGTQIGIRFSLELAQYGWNAVYFGGIYSGLDSAPTRISYTSIPDVEDF
jgi:hypothetical protein